MGCGHKIVLGSTCLSGVHVFEDDMYYGNNCLKGGHALYENIYYGKACLAGVHVFRISYLTG